MKDIPTWREICQISTESSLKPPKLWIANHPRRHNNIADHLIGIETDQRRLLTPIGEQRIENFAVPEDGNLTPTSNAHIKLQFTQYIMRPSNHWHDQTHDDAHETRPKEQMQRFLGVISYPREYCTRYRSWKLTNYDRIRSKHEVQVPVMPSNS